MSYHSSDQSFVFPSAYRTYNVRGRYTSEKNFTNMIKSLADKESFVVSFKVNGANKFDDIGDVQGNLMVIVQGYLFELTLFKLPATCWVGIKVDSNGYLLSTSGTDTNLDNDLFEFTGLEISTSAPSSTSELYWLQVTSGGKLVNTGYIEKLTDDQGNWYNLDDFFQKLISDIGSNINPIYWSKSENKLKASTATIGSRGAEIKGDVDGVYQNIYISNGNLTAGQKITISTKDPTGGKNANIGDLWFTIGA